MCKEEAIQRRFCSTKCHFPPDTATETCGTVKLLTNRQLYPLGTFETFLQIQNDRSKKHDDEDKYSVHVMYTVALRFGQCPVNGALSVV